MVRSKGASVLAGGRLAWARLRGRWLWVSLVMSLCLPLTVALIERRVGGADAGLRVAMTMARWVIPLGCFSLVWRLRRRQRMDDALWPLARFGAWRPAAAVGATSVAAVVGAGLAMVCCFVALMVNWDRLRGVGELWVFLWVCGLAALAYTTLFGLAGSYGRGGRACWGLLLADFLLGGGNGWLALPWPRAHVRSLLGGAAVASLPQASSSMLLVLMSAAALLLLAWRLPD